jgi:TolA-binding protein
MAQDFYSAFQLGNDDKHISSIDEGGVALAGVQALYRQSLKKDAEIQEQQAQIRTLTRQVQELEKVQRQMATLEARLAQIEARTAKPQPRSVKRTAPPKPAPGSVILAKAQF